MEVDVREEQEFARQIVSGSHPKQQKDKLARSELANY